MFQRIADILAAESITHFGMTGIENCDIINERLLPEYAESVVMMSIPYRTSKEKGTDGFSEYCRIYDSHGFYRGLFERVLPKIRALGCRCDGFSDHSPINEKLAAAKCGIGVVGRNSLLIDKVYGSFIFLGTIVTDIPCHTPPHEIEFCNNCGLCARACPNGAVLSHGINVERCLSGISQKKHRTDEENALLKKNGIAWGCDICQEVCPYNRAARLSEIPYFVNTRLDHITKEFVQDLTKEEFARYAFAYKGKKLVLDNIDLLLQP